MLTNKEQAVKQDDGFYDRCEQGAQLIETVQLSSVRSCVLVQIALDGIVREEVGGQAHLCEGSVHVVEEAGGFGGNAADLKVLEGELRRCVQEDDLREIRYRNEFGNCYRVVSTQIRNSSFITCVPDPVNP